MSFIAGVDEAKKLLGQGLTRPTDDVDVLDVTVKIGPKGEQTKQDVKYYYWEEVATLKRLQHENVKDEEWGDTDYVNIGAQISDDPRHASDNMKRWVSTERFRTNFFEVPFQYTTQEMETMLADPSHPHQYALYKSKETSRTMKLMAELLIATGHEDLLVGKKTFVGFTDPIIDLINGEELVNELVKLRVVSKPNRVTGAYEEFIVGFKLSSL